MMLAQKTFQEHFGPFLVLCLKLPVFKIIWHIKMDGPVVTRGRGREQAPDRTLGESSGTISSSSLNQWKDVSFFTFATCGANAVF